MQHAALRALFILASVCSLALPAAAQHSVTLNWTASVSDASHDAPTSYNIKRSLTTGTGYVVIATVPASVVTFIDAGTQASPLVPGTTYFYVVSAMNGAGESANSPEASAAVPAFRPNPPTNLKDSAQ